MRTNPTVEEWLEKFSPKQQSITRELIDVVRRNMPGVHEFIYHDAAGYSVNDSPFDRICYIAPQKQGYVNLGFFFGAGLSDPKKLLVGEGKRLRHVKIWSVKEARNPALAKLIAAAWKQADKGGAEVYTGMKKEGRMKPPELPVLPFASKKKWELWLARQHAKSKGIWLQLAKKDSGIPSLTYEEAVEVALCYGWIDGQKKSYDENYWLQKFTPRGPKSIWSRINTDKVERLIASGEMKPAGLRAIEAAKQDGRWDAAYASQKNISIPKDFQSALDGNSKAKSFYSTLKSAERYSLLFRIQTAKKPETRARRIQQFIQMLERNEKISIF
jgi:uncharacterized protein YdeI (YjbR/CyaY-like superfamily)